MTWRIAATALTLAALGVTTVGRAEPAPAQASTDLAVRADAYEARRWFWMAELAARLEDYDLATQVYQRLISRFPNTRWASTAQESLDELKDHAQRSFALWDPAAGGTPAGVRAAELLHAGEVAAAMEDWLVAQQFYERARTAAPGSEYARLADSRIRWIRHRHPTGP